MPTPFRFSQSVRCHFVAALLALAPAVLGATSYTIATFADDAVGNGNCTLREAIRAANTNFAVDACAAGGAADSITLPTGTYPFLGGETLFGTGSLTIQSATLNPFNVTIDLSDAGRFLTLGGSGSYVLGGLGVVNGLAPPGEIDGGAITADGVSLRIFNFRFVSNEAKSLGGALSFYSSFPGAGLVIHNGAFLSNSVSGSGSISSIGGAARVSVTNGADADFRDVTFQGNSAAESANDVAGGALSLQSSGTGSVARCVRCTFQNNSAISTALSALSSAEGGALYIEALGGALIELLDGRFSGNSAAGYITASKVPVLSGIATSGGSLLLERLFVDFNGGEANPWTYDVRLEGWNAASRISMVDSQLTFGSSNGLIVATTDSVVLLGHLTIADYSSGYGAFLSASGGQIALENSIVAFNWTDFNATGSVLQTTNLVGGDPLFLNEAGGDYHLSAASPAINAGTNGAPSVRLADLDHLGRRAGA